MDEQKDIPVAEQMKCLHDDTLTLIMSTLEADGSLETSYAPYVFNDGHYYILISGLAPHSRNLENHPHMSILLIEDESKVKNIFARLRLSYKASAKVVGRASDEFSTIIEKLQARAGKTVALLSSMEDFKLFKITPTQGRFIVGFGKAYLINAQTNEIIHVDKDLVAASKVA